MNIRFLLLDATHILEIIPLIQDFTSNKFSDQILEQRFAEMFTQNYECVGVYDGDQLIGITGLWYQTRHYAGKSCETDHVYIAPSYRSKKIGEQLFAFIERHARGKGCEAVELNTYVQNASSHKFYYNAGFNIIGFHFAKYF